MRTNYLDLEAWLEEFSSNTGRDLSEAPIQAAHLSRHPLLKLRIPLGEGSFILYRQCSTLDSEEDVLDINAIIVAGYEQSAIQQQMSLIPNHSYIRFGDRLFHKQAGITIQMKTSEPPTDSWYVPAGHTFFRWLTGVLGSFPAIGSQRVFPFIGNALGIVVTLGSRQFIVSRTVDIARIIAFIDAPRSGWRKQAFPFIAECSNSIEISQFDSDLFFWLGQRFITRVDRRGAVFRRRFTPVETEELLSLLPTDE